MARRVSAPLTGWIRQRGRGLTDVATRALADGGLELRAERTRVLAPANLEPARVEHETRDVGPLVERGGACRVDEGDELR